MLVVATDGAIGEVPDDLADGETLVDRRRAETQASAEALGIHRVEFLGYRDSGMTGWDAQRTIDDAFWQADLDEAATRLAEVAARRAGRRPHDLRLARRLRPSRPHPGAPRRLPRRRTARDDLPDLRVVESTMNRDDMRRGRRADRDADGTRSGRVDVDDVRPRRPDGRRQPDGDARGRDSPSVSTSGATSPTKRASISAHRSQVTDSGFFLQHARRHVRRSVRYASGSSNTTVRPGDPRMGWLFE